MKDINFVSKELQCTGHDGNNMLLQAEGKKEFKIGPERVKLN